MRKAVIYYFSGTGNTRCAAEKIASALSFYNIETLVWNVRVPFDSAPNPHDFDIVGFGYPIHAFNTPKFFLKFVRTLPKIENKQAFIFKTSGEPFKLNDASSLTLVKILKRKGFRVMLDRHLLMPYNIMFRYDDALTKQMYLHTAKMSSLVAYKISKNETEKIRYRLFPAAVMYLFRVQWFGARINGPLIYADKSLCTGCGLCAETCPAGNIEMKDGLPLFGSKCTMCMNCAFNCPVDAVRPGFLNRWRVNGAYPFEKIAADKNISDTFVNKNTKGYFKLFRDYYEKTNKEIAAFKAEQAEKII